MVKKYPLTICRKALKHQKQKIVKESPLEKHG